MNRGELALPEVRRNAPRLALEQSRFPGCQRPAEREDQNVIVQVQHLKPSSVSA